MAEGRDIAPESAGERGKRCGLVIILRNRKELFSEQALSSLVSLQMAVSQAQQGSLQLVLTRPAQHVADNMFAFTFG